MIVEGLVWVVGHVGHGHMSMYGGVGGVQFTPFKPPDPGQDVDVPVPPVDKQDPKEAPMTLLHPQPTHVNTWLVPECVTHT